MARRIAANIQMTRSARLKVADTLRLAQQLRQLGAKDDPWPLSEVSFCGPP